MLPTNTFLKFPSIHGFLRKALFKDSMQRQFIRTTSRILSDFDSFKIVHSNDSLNLSQLVPPLAVRASFAGWNEA